MSAATRGVNYWADLIAVPQYEVGTIWALPDRTDNREIADTNWRRRLWPVAGAVGNTAVI
jgi:hypothetical protein